MSKDALELVRRHIGGEYEVLFNGVDLDVIRSTPTFVDPAGDRQDVAGVPTIFFCGRHEHRKGLSVLLDAVEQMSGQTGYRSPCGWRATARRRRPWWPSIEPNPSIVWLGRISEAEKFGRLRACDVFCAPSLGGESFGVVLIEAMAAGATVVASALDGYRNVATDRVDSLLVPPDDVGALAAALTEVLGDSVLADRLRDAGARRAEDFAMSKLADRYVAIYERLIHSATTVTP